MGISLATDILPVWCAESLGFAVGSADNRNHRLTFADLLSSHLDIGWSQARSVLAGTFVAQQFFHCPWNQGRILPETLHVCRIAKQGEHAIPNQICGCLLATDHSDYQVGDDLLFR